MKKCSRCKEWKEFDAYQRDRRVPDGRQRACSVCRSQARVLQADRAKLKEHEAYERNKSTRKAYELHRRKTQPLKTAAKSAILIQRRANRLLPASSYLCVNCDFQAMDYHHQSYLPDDHLCVVPMCRSCHTKVHTQPTENLKLGIVPLKLGIVRIAIAGNL